MGVSCETSILFAMLSSSISVYLASALVVALALEVLVALVGSLSPPLHSHLWQDAHHL